MPKSYKALSICLIIVLLLNACGKSTKEIKAEREAYAKQLEETNKKKAAELSSRYNSYVEWDTLGAYTYVYQEIFLDKGQNMCFEGDLIDITKTDSLYYLNVVTSKWSNNHNYVARISISPKEFVKFKSALQSNSGSDGGCFIIKVTDIIPVTHKLSSEISYEGDDSYSTYFTNEFDETLLIFKGELLDFYLNKQVDKS